jgi:hypothetical protein
MSDPLLQLNAEIFAAQLHTKFKVQDGGGPFVAVELVEVLEPQSPPHVELFILHFRGPLAPRLDQRIHHFDHEIMGAFDLFLTAIGADAQGADYEAVFHRLRKKAS